MCEHRHFSLNFALHGLNSPPPLLVGLKSCPSLITYKWMLQIAWQLTVVMCNRRYTHQSRIQICVTTHHSRKQGQTVHKTAIERQKINRHKREYTDKGQKTRWHTNKWNKGRNQLLRARKSTFKIERQNINEDLYIY